MWFPSPPALHLHFIARRLLMERQMNLIGRFNLQTWLTLSVSPDRMAGATRSV
jgi:hypothetical protein